MRVLAVAQLLLPVEIEGEHGGKLLRGMAFALLQVAGDHRIVSRGVREGLGGEPRARVDGRGTRRVEFGQHRAVVRRIDQHRDVDVVLGAGPQHRRTTDVDLLDRFGVRAPGPRDRARERIEIHDQQVDRFDAVLAHRRLVDATPAEQAAVHARMQRLEPPVHQFGKAGEFRHRPMRQRMIGEQPRGAAGGKQLDAVAPQPGGELDQSGLVRDRQQCAPDGGGHQSDRPSARSFLRSVPRLMPRITAARLWLPDA